MGAGILIVAEFVLREAGPADADGVADGEHCAHHPIVALVAGGEPRQLTGPVHAEGALAGLHCTVFIGAAGLRLGHIRGHLGLGTSIQVAGGLRDVAIGGVFKVLALNLQPTVAWTH